MTKDDIYKPESIRAMSTILLSHLLQQTQCLVSLKIASSSTTEVIIAALQENPQVRNCLSNLRSLKQYNNVHPATTTLYSQLAKCAWNIEQLDMSVGTQMSELSTLISSQRNLKELTIR